MNALHRPRACGAGWRVLVALLVTVGVAPPPVAAAEALPWYQHYQRARERIAAGDCAGALADLEIAQRDRSAPRAEVRTYGNNFLFGYDPELLRARCLLTLERVEEATLALAASDAAAVSPQPERDAVRAAIAARRAPSPPVAPSTPTEGVSPVPAAVTQAPAAASPDLAPPVRRDVTTGTPTTATAEQPPPRPVPAATPVPSTPTSLAPEPPTSASTDRNRLSPPAPVGDTASGAEAPPRTGVPFETSQSPAAAPPPAPGEQPAAATAVPSPPETASPPSGAADAVTSAAEPASSFPGTLPLAALAGALVLAVLAWGWRARHGAHSVTVLGVRTGRLRRVDGYQLLDELGRGGMATTWRARRLADGREVALKIPHESGDPTFRERFLREGRLGETLHHPQVVRILDVGEDGGVPFLVMELLPGRTLRAELDAHPQGLDPAQAAALVRAIAEALDYAHGKGVVHRDLKPENVMLAPDGSVKVMDFGVARIEGQPGLTTSQVFFGSPLYAAPELVDPARIDRRADLYSLGALLWECLAGAPPYVDPSVFRVLELHQKAALPAPPAHAMAVPAELWEIATRLLAKVPDDRFQSAQELIVRLDRLSWRPTVPA